MGRHASFLAQKRPPNLIETEEQSPSPSKGRILTFRGKNEGSTFNRVWRNRDNKL
ncbi:MAG: hypothetical protein ACTS42_01310 [Candidatus Hodgkinia cicadicola]